MELKQIRTVLGLGLAISLLLGAVFAPPASASDVNSRYITVTAVGSTMVIPDAVRINAMVSILAKTSKDALAASSMTAAAVRRVLAANKIATKDIATQSVSVNPEYSYPQDGTAPVLIGYRASQSFSITVRVAATAGAIVDAIVDAGGNNLQLNGVSPFLLNDDKATATARSFAVGRAKANAASYAKLLGVKLGKVIYLDETSIPTPFPVFGVSAKAEDSATQIDLGEQKVSVSVTVRWAIG